IWSLDSLGSFSTAFVPATSFPVFGRFFFFVFQDIWNLSSFYICFIESLWYISCVNTRSQTYVKHVYCFVGWLVGCTIFG
uniref:Uncharacterized protein n=1 Tax=Glossina palpalis gambiensis TaxID=67801 RepID=A0A1B0BSQ9_9MUSC